MYISKVVSSQANICRAFVWSGKCLSGICLVGEVSVGDVSGRGSVRRGCVWSGKCPSGKCTSEKSPSGKCPSGMCPGINFRYHILNSFSSISNCFRISEIKFFMISKIVTV